MTKKKTENAPFEMLSKAWRVDASDLEAAAENVLKVVEAADATLDEKGKKRVPMVRGIGLDPEHLKTLDGPARLALVLTTLKSLDMRFQDRLEHCRGIFGNASLASKMHWVIKMGLV